MPRRWLAFVPILLPLLAFPQSRDTGQRPTLCQVSVKVTGDDSRPFASPVRVQLLSNTRTPIAETFTRDDGTATFSGVTANDYSVRVTSPDIEEASASFTIYPRQVVHTEYVIVRLKEAAIAKTSNQTSVSTASLNVPEKAINELDKGIRAMNQNKDKDAEKHISKALLVYPRFAAAWNARGALAMKSGDADTGRSMFEQALKMDDHFSEAYVNLAKLLMVQNKTADADTLLKKSITVNPRDVNALSLLANLDLTTGKLDEAVANAQKVHSLPHPNASVVHLIAATAFQRKGVYPDAAAEYRLFLQESPNSPSVDKVRSALDAVEKRMQ